MPVTVYLRCYNKSGESHEKIHEKEKKSYRLQVD